MDSSRADRTRLRVVDGVLPRGVEGRCDAASDHLDGLLWHLTSMFPRGPLGHRTGGWP